MTVVVRRFLFHFCPKTQRVLNCLIFCAFWFITQILFICAFEILKKQTITLCYCTFTLILLSVPTSQKFHYVWHCQIAVTTFRRSRLGRLFRHWGQNVCKSPHEVMHVIRQHYNSLRVLSSIIKDMADRLNATEVPFNVLFVPLIDVQHLMRQLCEEWHTEVSLSLGS